MKGKERKTKEKKKKIQDKTKEKEKGKTKKSGKRRTYEREDVLPPVTKLNGLPYFCFGHGWLK